MPTPTEEQLRRILESRNRAIRQMNEWIRMTVERIIRDNKIGPAIRGLENALAHGETTDPLSLEEGLYYGGTTPGTEML